MKITNRQLRRIIREEKEKSTIKYNADPALKGDQTKLPDDVQKGIIDKADKDAVKEAVLKRIIREMHPSKGVNFDITKDVAIEEDGLGSNQMITRDDFYDMISDFHKELHGIRFRDFGKLDAMNIQQVAEFYDDMFQSQEALDMKSGFDREDQVAADTELGHERDLTSVERSPKRQGMGRRTESIRNIKKIIKGVLRND